jgi:hypothetical protein
MASPQRVHVAFAAMAERPTRFEHYQWLGDKRTQVVHDVDACDQATIDDIVANGVGLAFGPDTLPEARNRGYRLHTGCAPDLEP